MSQRSLALNILAISRAYSIPYLSIAGVAALLTTGAPLLPRSLVGVIALPLCLTVGLAALNDASHAAADVRAGRGRNYPVSLLYALGGGGTVAAVLIALWGGLGVLAGIVGTVIGGVVYGLLKDRPGLGNVVRGVTTVPLVLGLGALGGAPKGAWILALALGVLDAAGNIYGDVRDASYDRQAGVVTLVVLRPRLAAVLAVTLHALAVLMLALVSGPWIALTLAGSAWVMSRQPHWQHRAFLMLKYVTVISVALASASTAYDVATVWAFTPGAALAWVIYTVIHQPRKEHVYAVTS